MARIKIARITEERPADPIHETLLTTMQSKIERGRNELDKSGSFKSIITVQAYPDALFEPGDLIRVELDGEVFVGLVQSINITIGRGDKSLTLQVERSLTNA